MKDVTQSSVCALCHQEVDAVINLTVPLDEDKQNTSVFIDDGSVLLINT